MKLKLDENLGRRSAVILRDAGHDIETVVSENLAGATDPIVLDACRNEDRSLVTLDVEFANPLVYPPHSHAGVILIRIRDEHSPAALEDATRVLATALAGASPAKQIWIVQRDRVRVYQPE